MQRNDYSRLPVFGIFPKFAHQPKMLKDHQVAKPKPRLQKFSKSKPRPCKVRPKSLCVKKLLISKTKKILSEFELHCDQKILVDFWRNTDIF